MFLRNAWYVAASREEVGDKPLARTLLDEPVVLFRTPQGAAAALEDRCCHRGAPLSLGWPTEKGLMCGYHGLVFDGSGTCVDIPGHAAKIPAKARVRFYPVAEKGPFVWIWMGDPALADPSQVIDYPADDPKVPRGHELLYVKGNYEMVIDNLTDLSHLAYLHRTTIGSSGDETARAELKVERTPNGMRFLQLLRDVSVPASQANWFKGNIDRWHDFEYIAPSLVVQWTASAEAGGFDKGINRTSVRILHAATPETVRTTHYFYCYADDAQEGYRREIKQMGALLYTVFQDDLRMIEHQQVRMEGHDRNKLVNIPSDGARIMMAAVLAEKIRAEQAGGAPLARAS